MNKSFEFSNNEILFGDNKCNPFCFTFADDIVLEFADREYGLNDMCYQIGNENDRFAPKDQNVFWLDKENVESNAQRKTNNSAPLSSHDDSLSLCARMSENMNKSVYNTNNSDVNSSLVINSPKSKVYSSGNSSHIFNMDFDFSEKSSKVNNYNDEVDNIIKNLLDDEVMINTRDKKSGHYCTFNRKSNEEQRELIWRECNSALKENKSIPQSLYEKLAVKTGLDISQIKKINYNMRWKQKLLEKGKKKNSN